MKNREVLIGVTGGIAAYKTAGLVSQIVQAGGHVSVVLTESAAEFVGPATFAALSGRPVASHRFDSHLCPLGEHIELAERADILCIAPATANFLAKAAAGIADDVLSTLYLAFTGPVLVAPAMSPDMWAHPAVVRNVAQLTQDGVLLLPPDEGWVACRRHGPGRMAAPERIFSELELQLADL